jgi:DoxX-like family
MEIILISISMIGGGLLSFVFKADSEFAVKLAKFYIWLVLALSTIAGVFYFAGIKGQFITIFLGGIVSSGKYPARILLGYLITTIFLSIKTADYSSTVKKLIRLTLAGVSLATGLSFLIAVIGKATNFTDMAAFFAHSGYAIWFLYFIMVAESLGALGVLLHFKLKTGPLATTGLMLVMIGALYTHRHNNDPFSDSYAALGQFITLGLILVMYYFEREAKFQTPVMVIMGALGQVI